MLDVTKLFNSVKQLSEEQILLIWNSIPNISLDELRAMVPKDAWTALITLGSFVFTSEQQASPSYGSGLVMKTALNTSVESTDQYESIYENTRIDTMPKEYAGLCTDSFAITNEPLPASDYSKEEDDAGEENGSIVDFFKNNFGKIGIIVGATAIILLLYYNRDKFSNVWANIGNYIKDSPLAWVWNSAATVGQQLASGTTTLWDRLTKKIIPKSESEVVNIGRALNYFGKRFNVSPRQVLELAVFLKGADFERYVNFVETEEAVRVIKQSEQKFDWQSIGEI